MNNNRRKNQDVSRTGPPSYVSVRLRAETYGKLLRAKAFLISKRGANIGLSDTIDELIVFFAVPRARGASGGAVFG